MAIDFRGVTHPPLDNLTIGAPERSIIGIAGLEGSGKSVLLELAAGLHTPAAGSITGPADRRLIRPGEPLDFSAIGVLALDAALAGRDPLVRERACLELERLRRSGATILIASHDHRLLARLCDEIWWLDGGRLAGKGDSREILPKYNRFVADRLSECGGSLAAPADFGSRHGDGRAEIVSLETAGPSGQPSAVLKSGDPASVRVLLRLLEPVENPVIGIMIRTRIGLEVYGTNTELEGLQLGPRAAGDELVLEFRFRCDLCPGEYTLTAASHDPDGTAHDWLDDALTFLVADHRYTAGVANLRAMVTVKPAGAAQ